MKGPASLGILFLVPFLFLLTIDNCRSEFTYGDACNATVTCESSNLQCSGDVCRCLDNQYWNSTTCTSKLTYGNACNASVPCVDSLQCIGKMCGCPNTEYWNSTNCTPKITFGSTCSPPTSGGDNPCDNRFQCLDSGSTKICKCSGDNYFNGAICTPKITFGSSCSPPTSGGDNPCDNRFQCLDSGSIKICKCSGDNYFNGAICTPKITFGSTCSPPTSGGDNPCDNRFQCLDSGSTKICKCSGDNYFNGAICTPKITFGSSCSPPTSGGDNPCDNRFQCLDSGSTKICKCSGDNYFNGAICTPKITFGSTCSPPTSGGDNPCDNRFQCLDSGSTKICKCSGDNYFNGAICTPKITFGSSCSPPTSGGDNPCDNRFQCLDSGSTKICKCSGDNYFNGAICTPKITFGSTCSPPTSGGDNPCDNRFQCLDSGSTKICKCSGDNYFNGAICTPKITFGSTCSPPTSGGDNPCDNRFQCLDSGSTKICKCSGDNYFNGAICTPKITFGSTCSPPTSGGDNPCDNRFQCLDSGSTKICKCSGDNYFNGALCTPKITFGSTCSPPTSGGDNPCDNRFQCLESGSTKICKCSGDNYFNGALCTPKITFGSTCSPPTSGGDNPCDDRFQCLDSGSTKICKCSGDNYFNGAICTQKITFGSSCSPPTSGGDNPCDNRFQCLDSGSTKICKCSGDNYFNGAICTPKITFGSTCSPPTSGGDNPCDNRFQCLDSGSTKICKCSGDNYFNGAICTPKITFGSTCSPPTSGGDNPCDNRFQCLDSGSTKICKCSGDNYFNGALCTQKITFGSTCSPPTSGGDNPCDNRFQCLDSGSTKICKCSGDNYFNGAICTPKLPYNDSCVSVNPVGDENPCQGDLLCRGSPQKCQCEVGFFWYMNNCVKDKGHGSFCNNEQVCDVKFKCISSRCQCNSTTYYRGDACYSVNELIINLNLNNASVTPHGISLHWAAREDIDRYTVMISPEASNIDVNHEGNRLTVTSLSSGTSYLLTVTPIVLGLDLNKTVPNTAITIFTKPAKPSQLVVVDSSAPDITLKWTRSPGGVNYYFVTLQDFEDAAPFFQKTTADNNPQITFNDTRILPGRKYTVAVQAKLNQVQGVKDNTSEALRKTFSTDATAPGPPSNLTSGTVSKTSIELSWSYPKNPNGNIMKYIIVVKSKAYKNETFEERKHEETEAPTENSGSTATITELTAGTFYSFDVFSVNENHTGTEPANVQARTKESTPSAVENFRKGKINSRDIQFLWQRPSQPHGDILLYELQVSKGDQCEMNVRILCTVCGEYTGDITSYCTRNLSVDTLKDAQKDITYTATKLLPETKYSVKITAYTGQGVGDQSGLSEAETKAEVPLSWDDTTMGKFASPTDKTPATQTTFEINIRSEFYDKKISGTPIRSGLMISEDSKKDKDSTIQTVDDYNSFTTWHVAKQEQFKPYLVEFDNEILNLIKENHRMKRSVNDKVVPIVIGSDDKCSQKSTTEHCNGPLEPGTKYVVKGVTCTTAGCTDTSYQGPFVTQAVPEEPPPIGGIVGGVAAALVAAGVVVFIVIFVLRRRKKKTNNTGDDVPLDPAPVKIQKKRPIKLSTFDEHVEKLSKDQGLLFTEEYDDVQTLSPKHSMESSQMDENRAKNRYLDIRPFDHSRVKLIPIDDETNDYINANYIEGYNSRREYIAAQGPLPGTIDDFWRMVWEQNVRFIVMMTKCKEKNIIKCEQYWPEYSADKKSEPLQYGDVIVNLVSESHMNTHIIRIFKVKLGDQVRDIRHFHYIVFGDHTGHGAVGTAELVDFAEMVRGQIPPNNPGPIVVHCSAGVGRTGTFIAMDHFRQFLAQHTLQDSIDLFSMVMKMRENRCKMVQNESQYVLIHHCVSEILKRRRKEEENENENLYANQPQDNTYENHGFDEPLYSNVDMNGKNVMKTEI